MSGKVRMTRRVTFSSGHRYWLGHLSASENKELFGPWASPYNHGHNYVLDVAVEGGIDPVTGMIVNIKRIDDVLKDKIVHHFDQKSINDEVAYFRDRAPSLENLMAYFWDVLSTPGTMPADCQMVSIRLEEMPTLFGELENNKMTLTRSYEFAASHRLDSPALTPEQNVELFGKCNNAAGHGHNYILEVTVEGELNPKTGMMVDLGELDRTVNEAVVDRYDHKNFNEDLPEFAGKMTTSEVIAQEIFDRLQSAAPAKLNRIRLWETARNMFEVSAS